MSQWPVDATRRLLCPFPLPLACRLESQKKQLELQKLEALRFSERQEQRLKTQQARLAAETEEAEAARAELQQARAVLRDLQGQLERFCQDSLEKESELQEERRQHREERRRLVAVMAWQALKAAERLGDAWRREQELLDERRRLQQALDETPHQLQAEQALPPEEQTVRPCLIAGACNEASESAGPPEACSCKLRQEDLATKLPKPIESGEGGQAKELDSTAARHASHQHLLLHLQQHILDRLEDRLEARRNTETAARKRLQELQENVDKLELRHAQETQQLAKSVTSLAFARARLAAALLREEKQAVEQQQLVREIRNLNASSSPPGRQEGHEQTTKGTGEALSERATTKEIGTSLNPAEEAPVQPGTDSEYQGRGSFGRTKDVLIITPHDHASQLPLPPDRHLSEPQQHGAGGECWGTSGNEGADFRSSKQGAQHRPSDVTRVKKSMPDEGDVRVGLLASLVVRGTYEKAAAIVCLHGCKVLVATQQKEVDALRKDLQRASETLGCALGEQKQLQQQLDEQRTSAEHQLQLQQKALRAEWARHAEERERAMGNELRQIHKTYQSELRRLRKQNMHRQGSGHRGQKHEVSSREGVLRKEGQGDSGIARSAEPQELQLERELTLVLQLTRQESYERRSMRLAELEGALRDIEHHEEILKAVGPAELAQGPGVRQPERLKDTSEKPEEKEEKAPLSESLSRKPDKGHLRTSLGTEHAHPRDDLYQEFARGLTVYHLGLQEIRERWWPRRAATDTFCCRFATARTRAAPRQLGAQCESHLPVGERLKTAAKRIEQKKDAYREQLRAEHRIKLSAVKTRRLTQEAFLPTATSRSLVSSMFEGHGNRGEQHLKAGGTVK